LAEMYDMREAGAVAFSDGLQPVQSPGLLLKALQYVKAFEGVLVQMPIEQSIGGKGLVHEGIVSTQMGLPGIPYLCETSMVKRDLDLLSYTGSKLHITGISSAQSVELIREAKAKGLAVTCSVTPYHLHFTDADLAAYNTHLKVNPPLREAKDREVLRMALVDGTIDTVASHHFPHDWDHKTCEFEAAAFGMSGLETTVAATLSALPNLTPDRWVEIFSLAPRKIFGLPATHVAKGQIAELSLLDPHQSTQLTGANSKSKSVNNAFIGKTLSGKIIGTIFNQHHFFA
jgi:dihydroorotase